jgi:hypothetical protein
MNTLTFIIKYKINSGIIVSPDEFIQNQLFGVELATKNGDRITTEAIRNKLFANQELCEKLFAIKINYQIITESNDYDRQQYLCWGQKTFTYQVNHVLEFTAWYGTAQQSTYPVTWATQRLSVGDNITRNVSVVPNGNFSIQQNSVLFQGLIPQLGFQGLEYIPNYWRLKYLSGFDVTPKALSMLIQKLTAIDILTFVGDVTYGAGINNMSLSVDGLSQSTTKFGSGKGIYSGRIEQYIKEINGDNNTRGIMKTLRDYYLGITFMCV